MYYQKILVAHRKVTFETKRFRFPSQKKTRNKAKVSIHEKSEEKGALPVQQQTEDNTDQAKKWCTRLSKVHTDIRTFVSVMLKAKKKARCYLRIGLLQDGGRHRRPNGKVARKL